MGHRKHQTWNRKLELISLPSYINIYYRNVLSVYFYLLSKCVANDEEGKDFKILKVSDTDEIRAK